MVKQKYGYHMNEFVQVLVKNTFPIAYAGKWEAPCWCAACFYRA